MSSGTPASGRMGIGKPAGLSPGKSVLLGGGMIALAALVAYHNSFGVPFLLDDHLSILDNPTIRHLWPLGDALNPRANSVVGGRPIMNLSLAINYALGGFAVGGYHALDLAIHILAGLTLFGIVRRTLLSPLLRERFGASATWLALAAAILWTVHPLQTEAVTYLSERCESLMGLFYLLTLYGFIRGSDAVKSAGWFALSVVACFLGMASKEVMVTAPVMVWLYDRTFVSGNFRDAWKRHRWFYLGLAASWLWLGYLMRGLVGRGAGYGLGISWWGYAWVECRAVAHYLGLAFWPHPLIFDYGQYAGRGNFTEVAPYAAALMALAVVVLFKVWRRSASGFLGAWFFVVLAPTSSVVPIGGAPMAEHRMYLPLAAVAVAVVVGAFVLGERLLQERRRVVFGCAAGGFAAVLLTLLTIQRNRDYRSDVDLWQDTVAKCPHNARAHVDLGFALLGRGRSREAIDQYEQALRIEPRNEKAHNDLGSALMAQGRVAEAMQHWEEAVRLKPDYAEAHGNLGVALRQTGRPQEAIAQYEEALRIKPDYAEAHFNWANALIQIGSVPEAIAHYEQALKIRPDYAAAHVNLGAALEKMGRNPEAIEHYQQALKLRPGFAAASNALARLQANR